MLELNHALVKANKSRGEDERAKSLIYTVCVCTEVGIGCEMCIV